MFSLGGLVKHNSSSVEPPKTTSTNGHFQNVTTYPTYFPNEEDGTSQIR